MKRQALIVIASAFVLGALSDEGTSKVWYEGSGSCGGVPPDTTLPDPGPEWDPLSKYHQYGDWAGEFDISTVNPTFANMFDLWVTESIVARWDSTAIAYLTFRIVDADSTNDDDVFPRVWDYFMDADEDPSYGGLQYTFSDDSTYTRIILRLWDNEDIPEACSRLAYNVECNGYSTVRRPQENYGPYRAFTLYAITPDSLRACDGPWVEFTVEQLVTDTFAHELQHICFGLNGHSARYHEVNESLSKLAEYIAGAEQNKDCDISYDSSIIRGDRCEATRKYQTELVWMTYLYDRFAVSPSDISDDLAYRWLREDQVTLASLANLLEDEDFAWLGGSTGDDRFNSLFQSFAIAKFADAPDVTADRRYGYEKMNPTRDVGLMLDNCTFYAPGACPARPIDCGGTLPPGCTSIAGCWNVKILPPIYDLTSSYENSLTTLSAIFEDPGDLSRDSLEVASYGTDYIVFRADDYYNDGEQHEFRFNIDKLEGTVPSNARLQFSVIAYSSLEDTLQLHPEDVLFTSPVVLNEDGNGGSFVVTDFGRTVKSVVVVLSLTEESVGTWALPVDFKYYVYEYEYGVFTPGELSSLQWAGDVFVTGDYNIAAGTELSISSGAAVHVWTEDLADEGVNTASIEFHVYGDLEVSGTSARPVTFGAWDMTGESTANDDWWGVFVHTGGSGVFEHTVVRNALYGLQGNAPMALTGCLIEAGHLGVSVAYAGAVSVDSTTIRGSDYGINALLGTNLTLSNSTIEDCSLYGVALYKDATLNATGTTFDGNDIGLYLSSESESWVKATVEGCTFTYNADGIWIDDVGDSLVVVKDCTITNSTTSGIYVEDWGDVRITGNTITDGTIGIYSYNSSPRIRFGNVIQDNAGGIKCDNYSYAVVESCTVTNNATGVAIINDSDPDLGHTSGGNSTGHNILNLNTNYFVSNLTSNTVSAESNYWGGGASPCYPKASKIYGPVDYVPSLCSAPSLTSPFSQPAPRPESVPTRFGLSQNYPNPFNPTTTVSYDVPEPGAHVQVQLYDVTGRLVATLVDEQKQPGRYQATWDGRNQKGQPTASGMYFVRMRSGSYVETKKLLMLK